MSGVLALAKRGVFPLECLPLLRETGLGIFQPSLSFFKIDATRSGFRLRKG